jgi:uncharacterized membrane protein
MSFSQIAYNYLLGCNIKVSKDYFEQRIKSHPNYPALLSLIDTLNELDLENKAVQAEEKNILQFSFPFLAQTPKAVNGFEIVPSIEYYERNKEKFLNRWEGIAVMVKSGQTINNQEHEKFLKKKKENDGKLILASLVGFFFYSVITVLNFYPAFAVFSFLSICGIAISSLIILHKFGKSNSFVQRFCDSGKSHDCDLVLNSRVSEIIKGVHFGDIGFIYFLGITFYYLFSGIGGFGRHAFALLTLPSCLAFVFSFFSVYYQWKIVKAWCKMCVMTIAIIWLQAILSFFYVAETKQIIFNPQILLQFSLAFLLAFGWLLIKPLIKIKLDDKESAIKLLKWKRNPDIFQALLQQQPYVDTFVSRNPVQFGKVDSPLQLTIVSNPFCRPCAIAHKELEELYKRFSGLVSLNVIFLVKSATDKEDRKTIAVEHILEAILSTNNKLQVLHEWFETMNIEKWEEKYPCIQNSNVLIHLQNYEYWLQNNIVPHTPLIYMNGNLFPKQYVLKDIESLAIELSETLTKATVKKEAREEIADLSWK